MRLYWVITGCNIVNWKLNKLDVSTHTCKAPSNPLPNSNCLLVSPRAGAPVDSNTPQEKPVVSLISVVAYICACRTRELLVFQLTIRDLGTLHSHLTRVGKTKTDMSLVPDDYLEFADVSNKQQAKQLPPHCSHDLTIHIKDSSIPPLGPIYLLLPTELDTL